MIISVMNLIRHLCDNWNSSEAQWPLYKCLNLFQAFLSKQMENFHYQITSNDNTCNIIPFSTNTKLCWVPFGNLWVWLWFLHPHTYQTVLLAALAGLWWQRGGGQGLLVSDRWGERGTLTHLWKVCQNKAVQLAVEVYSRNCQSVSKIIIIQVTKM